MTEEQRSLKRSKKTLVTLAELMGPRILDVIAPGTGVAINLSKISYEHIRQYIRDRSKQRIEDLHRILLEGCKDDKELEKLVKKKFNPEDYYGILTAVVQDEEDLKTEIYAKIFRAVLNGRIEAHYKTHIIKSSRELTVKAFELMKKLYIASDVLFEDESNLSDQVQELLRSDDPLHRHTVQSLIRYGYIADVEGMTPITREITKLLKVIITSIYTEEELTPEAIGKRSWGSTLQIALIASNINNEHVQAIKSYLERLDISLTLLVPKRAPTLLRNQLHAVPSGQGIAVLYLICADGDERHNDEIAELLLDSWVRNLPPTIITLPGAIAKIYEAKGLETIDMSRDFDQKLDKLQDELKYAIDRN